MKYRVLLAGKNRAIVDDFFRTMDDRFECLTTSNRAVDMANHMTYFKPDAFVYCFASESKEDIGRLIEGLETVDKEHQQMVLIGDPEHCDEFMRRKPQMVKMVLHRPITGNTIKEKLIKYFEKNNIGADRLPKEEQQESLQELCNMVNSFRMEEEKPAPKPEPVPVKEPEPAPAPQIHAEPQSELKHVLIIDDDLMMLRLVKEELKDKYNVATAISGKIGLKFLEKRTTDLILLDYEMPEENGAEVLEKLRANPQTKNIPVVFLTGMNNREKIKQLVAMKPQGYLLKPIKCEQLVDTIRQIIG